MMIPDMRLFLSNVTCPMHCIFLLIFSSFTSSHADETFHPKTETCCWPIQFQAHIARHAGTPVTGSPGIFEEEMLLMFDHPRKRWGFWLRENFFTNEYTELIYVENFKERKATFGVVPHCARIPIPEEIDMKHPCLPAHAKYIETSWLGDGALPYDVWEWEIGNFVSDGDVTTAKVQVSISHDNCKPISDIGWWTERQFNHSLNIGYLSYHLGEADEESDPFLDLSRFYDCKDYDVVEVLEQSVIILIDRLSYPDPYEQQRADEAVSATGSLSSICSEPINRSFDQRPSIISQIAATAPYTDLLS